MFSELGLRCLNSARTYFYYDSSERRLIILLFHMKQFFSPHFKCFLIQAVLCFMWNIHLLIACRVQHQCEYWRFDDFSDYASFLYHWMRLQVLNCFLKAAHWFALWHNDSFEFVNTLMDLLFEGDITRCFTWNIPSLSNPGSTQISMAIVSRETFG